VSGTLSERASLDPTALTTDQIRREIAGVREIFEAKLTALAVRLEDMNKATMLLNENVTRFPTEIDKQIGRLQELTEQRFKGIETQFTERDVRSAAGRDAAQVAVAVGLQAQKESAASTQASNAAAITKSETATAKQIDGITLLLATTKGATDDKINDLRRSIDRGDGKDVGHTTAAAERAASQASMVAIVSLIVSALVGGGSLLAAYSHNGAPLSVVPPATVQVH